MEPTVATVGYLLPSVTLVLLAYYAADLYGARDRSGVPVVGWISPIQPRVAAVWYIFKQKTLLDEAYEKAPNYPDYRPECPTD